MQIRPFSLQADGAASAQSNLGDDYAMPLHEATGHATSMPTDRSWLASARIGISTVVPLLKIVWASPWSLCGLAIGLMGLLSGGGVQRSGRILEFWGGGIPLFLKYFPFAVGSAAIPFGHVVLGRSPRYLDACRSHQLVHVRQYEFWGPLFVPIYLLCGIVLWCLGKRPYYDHPFEREAYAETW